MTQTEAGVYIDDGRCFACGRKNALGLKMRFAAEGRGVAAEVALPAWLQGWRGVAHGGIVSLLLDEAMAHAIGHTGALGVTASMSLRFRKPIPLGEPLTVQAWIIEQRLRAASTEARILDAAAGTLAEASAKFIIVGRLPPGAKLGDETDDHG